jgi:enoyl-CoA hydratase/carnithine racemase
MSMAQIMAATVGNRTGPTVDPGANYRARMAEGSEGREGGERADEAGGDAGGDASGDAGDDVGGDVRYEVADGVARLTIDRPERRNALSFGVIRELRRRVAECRDDPAARVLVLTGAGDRAFCAGADLGGLAAGAGYLDLHDARGELASLFGELWSLGKPTIARVRGYALAGGMGLALSCDLVVASDDAQFGTPEIDIGLWPYMITVPLTRSMPPKKALELMMTGRRVGAAEADRIGFVTRVVPAGELDAAVDELAATLAAKSPAIMRLGRDSFYRVWDQAAADALAQLHPLLTVTTGTADATEGITAFLEKRPPTWTGR